MSEFNVHTFMSSSFQFHFHVHTFRKYFGKVWLLGHSGLLQAEVAEDPDESAEPSAKGRALYSRRRRGNQDLPPRARYINKILIYLNQEMATRPNMA